MTNINADGGLKMAEYIERTEALEITTRTCGDYAAAWSEIRKLPAADVIERPQWISVEDKLPDTETEVLVVCNRNGFRFICPAIYEDGTVLTQDSIWNWYELDNYGTYSEENDDYFIPECWWENRHFTPDDVYNSQVDCPVTHWMPLPAPPNNIEED